ncbi:MAG: lysophospholipid acyltransferase family protein [Rhizobiaceae bacterium]
MFSPSIIMLYLRSLLFNLVWYINIIVQMLVQLPIYFFLDHEHAQKIPKRWGLSNHWLHRVLVGTKMEVIGKENLLEDGCIVACKHQSIWEFYAVNAMLKNPAFVLKAELMKIPVFGWYVGKLKHIPIRRGDKGSAMRKMISVARERIAEGRQILIFPEGTRKAPGADPDYRYGVTRMYLDLNCPVVPVALDSGLYWPRRKFLRYPGVLRTKILEPIMPGLSGPEFSAELERRIEEACDELYFMTSKDAVHPPLNDAVMKRVKVAQERLNSQSDS